MNHVEDSSLITLTEPDDLHSHVEEKDKELVIGFLLEM